MKILMLTSFMDMGGAETHISELCLGLRSAGHTVEVASSGGRCADMLESRGIPQHRIPLGSKAPLAVMGCLFSLWKLVRHGGYDAVHAHSRIPAAMCAVLGISYITTAHLDFKVDPILRRITKWGERTIAVSDDIRDYLIREYGVRSENVSVTVNGIDTDRFAPSEKYRREIRCEFGIAEEDRLIVYISRLDSDRSLSAKLFCKIMPRLLREYPNVRLLIVGDGDDVEAVQSLGGESVIFAGARHDIEKFTAAADIVCGVSRSALEAMSSGCPVILSGNQGHMGVFAEDMLINAAKSNFCCRGCAVPTEELLYRDAVSLLSLDMNGLRELGEHNRTVILKNYSVARMTEKCISVYEDHMAVSSQRNPDAVVSGYFGYGNSGDDTALDCLVAAVRREKPNAVIAVLCRDPESFGRMHRVIGIGRYDVLSAVRALRQSGLLISGGGSLLQNVTSTRSLRYYAGVIGLAKLCGAKVFICANGIGPIKGERGRRIARKAVMRADSISVRDEDSRRTLGRLGIPENAVAVTADPAFRLTLGEKCDVTDLKKSIGMRDGMKYFAVSLRSAMCKGERVGEICRTCRDIYLTFGYTPIFVSMQESEDGGLCRRIAEETCGEAVFVPSVPPHMLYSLISETELVLSMRLHLIIYAAAAGVPAVGLSVDPKVDAVARILPSAAIVNGSSFTLKECLSAVKSAVSSDRESLLRIAREQAMRSENDAVTAVRLMRDESGMGKTDGCDTAEGSAF